MNINSPAFRAAQARYDNAEPDHSAEYRRDADMDEAGERMDDPDYIADALHDGLRSTDGLAALSELIAAYRREGTAVHGWQVAGALMAAVESAVLRMVEGERN